MISARCIITTASDRAGDAEPRVARRHAQDARGRRGGCRRPWPSRRTSPRRASSISPARPSAAFRLAASTCRTPRRRSVDPVGVLGLVLVGVLDLDPVALERAVDELAVDDDGLALLEDPAGLALVAHRHRGAVEGDRERRDAVDRRRPCPVDGALHAQAAAGLAAVALADLVDVAVVVDGRAQELGDDHAAGDEHEGEHDDRRPAARDAAARRRRRRRCAG